MEPVESKVDRYNIYALEDGGFVARRGPEDFGNGSFNPPVFACTTMNELLAYIRRHLGWSNKKAR